MNIDSYNDSLRIFDSYGVHLDISHYGIFFGGNSLNTNGYNRLNNNLILQWGRVAFSGKSTYITFPITFSSVFTVLTGVSNNSTDQYGDNNARDISNSGFTGWKYQEDAHTLFWLAVGI